MRNDSSRLPLVSILYQKYLDDQDAVTFTSEISRKYSQGTLQRLVSHYLPQVRRSAVLALGFIGDYEANPSMGQALIDDDRTVRMIAENGIRQVWARAGTPHQQKKLSRSISKNSSQLYDEAIQVASELIEEVPWFAEAWNQRAIARFALGQYVESIRDWHQSLEINPYHFAAATGMGQAYIELGNHISALEAFRRALRLNRDIEGVRSQVARLTRLIEGK